MFVEEQRMLGRFFLLTLPRFVGASSKDAFVFLIVCEDRLPNLGLVKTHGINYITF